MIELLLFCTGIVAGIMNAIAGGGGLITFPVMMLAGMPPIVANATNHVAVLPGNIVAVFSYRKYLQQIPRRYLLLTVPCIIGATMGALILRSTDSSHFDKIVPALLAFAVVLFIFQPILHQHLHNSLRTRTKKQPGRWRKLFIMSLAIMPVAIYGGYFGPGFGFIMLAFLGFTKMNKHMHEMTALKTLIGLCVAAISAACLLTSGLIDMRGAALLACGNIFGGYFGAQITQRVSSHSIRLAVISIGVCAALYLGLREYDTSQQIQTMLQSPLSLAFRTLGN